MTNEEARDQIVIFMCDEQKVINDRDKQALEMAIKALEQEPETGYWEWVTEDKYRCSNCNSETRVDECLNEPMYEFCPFCGCKMSEIPTGSESEE